MLAVIDKIACETASPGRFESLLSCHLYDVVIRATAAVLCTLMSVRLGQSCPQQAGSWVVEMGEETRWRRAGVGRGESSRPGEERGGEHPRLGEQ